MDPGEVAWAADATAGASDVAAAAGSVDIAVTAVAAAKPATTIASFGAHLLSSLEQLTLPGLCYQ